MEDKQEKQKYSISKNYIIQEGKSRKDSLLKWKDGYSVPGSKYYNYHQETTNIASISSLRTTHNKTAEDFSWRQQCIKSFKKATSLSSEKAYKPRPKTCHTTTDIGDCLIIIGGMSGKMDCVTALKMNKKFDRLYPLTKQKGLHPCCRWAHAASYIAPLNAIIMSGGFDSTYNWNDIRLLFLSHNNDYGEWFQLEAAAADTEMGCRALHSSTVRYITVVDKDKKMKRNICEVYIFGGQYCSGGPYIYNNNLFRIQVYDDVKPLKDDNDDINAYMDVNIYGKQLKAFIRSDIIMSRSEAVPDARSQQFAWIDDTNDRYWIYGGLDATQEFNDLWCFDLTRHEWMNVPYSVNNVLKAPTVKTLNAHNFRLCLYGDKLYYSLKQNKLLVMHCVDRDKTFVSMMTSAVKTWQEIMAQKKERNDDGNAQVLCSAMDEQIKMIEKMKELCDNVYWLYVLDLKNKMWDIVVDCAEYRPKYTITASGIHRIGDRIWMIGGRDDESRVTINRLNNINGFKIPSIAISWKQEREIWIGHFKNDDNKLSFLSCLPKELIVVILLFFKQNTW